MGFSRGRSSPFTCPVAFANDGCSVGVHRYPDPGDVDCEEAPTVFAGEHTARFEGLPVPAVKPEDPVGSTLRYRDRADGMRMESLCGVARASGAATTPA